MNKKDTVLILYTPGSYGTFLEWSLMFFSGLLENSSLPFRNTGSSHEYIGNHLGVFDSRFLNLSLTDYIKSDLDFKIVRAHFNNSEDLEEKILNYKNYVKLVIVIMPDAQSRLLVINNALTKLNSQSAKIYADYINGSLGVDLSQKKWEQRERISFTIAKFNYTLPLIDSDDIVTVTVTDLVNDYKNQISSLLDTTGLGTNQKRLVELDRVKTTWLDLQSFLHRDQLCEKIVDSTVSDILFDWSDIDLSIYDEAYVQYLLKHLHSAELLCYNLNEFPTNSIDLRRYLINAKSI